MTAGVEQDQPSSGVENLTQVILVGIVAGFLSGLFGVGGGILIVPALVMVLRMDQRLAHGTSLAAILPIALSGTIGYALDESIDWVAAGALVVGSATVGARLGTNLLHTISRRGLAIGFGVVLILTALRMVLDNSEGGGRGDLTVAMLIALVLAGVVAGTLAGLLGVGGGIVMVPVMVVLFGISAAVAKGTSLAVIIPTALVATRRNAQRRNVDLRVAVVVGLAGVASSFVAAQISLGLDEQLSNRLFAGLLAVIAVRMLVDEVRRPAEP